MVEDEQGRRRVVRASDIEREEALRALAGYFSEGRLDRAEFDERADVALQARTQDELRALFADLPTRPAALAPRQDATPTGPFRRGPVRAGGPPLFPLVPLLLALSVVAVLHGLPPFPLIALVALRAANRRGRLRFGNDKY